jgi:large subunit ribosomal protein L25
LELIELKSKIRSGVGNGPARVLRRDGKIPAVLYGPKTAAVLLSVDVFDLKTALKTGKIGQSLFNLSVDGETAYNKTVMIKELQRHPATYEFLHADFYEIAMDRKTTVNIPVIAIGKSIGVELGGILQIIRREVEISCLPTQIPDSIILDTTDLDIGDSIHAKDIVLEEGIEILTDVNFTVITVSSPKLEEEPVEEEEELEEGEEAEGDEESTETESEE